MLANTPRRLLQIVPGLVDRVTVAGRHIWAEIAANPVRGSPNYRFMLGCARLRRCWRSGDPIWSPRLARDRGPRGRDTRARTAGAGMAGPDRRRSGDGANVQAVWAGNAAAIGRAGRACRAAALLKAGFGTVTGPDLPAGAGPGAGGPARDRLSGRSTLLKR